MSATTLLTFAQFEALPDKPGRQELLHGRLIEMPPPKSSHQQIVQSLYELLRTVLDKRRAWMGAGYRISDGWLVPNVSVAWPEQKYENDYAVHSPLIAVEVVSPANTAQDLEEKVAAYLHDGAAEAWVIYPTTKTMLVHSAGGALRVSEDYQTALLPGFTLSIPSLFE